MVRSVGWMNIRIVATHVAAAQRKRVLRSCELKWSHAGSDFLPGGSSEDIVVLELMVMQWQWQWQEKRRIRR
jgi:hypothetical protein